MYERFSDRARKVMQLAKKRATQGGDRHLIHSVDVLHAIIEEGSGVATNVLKNLGVNLDALAILADDVAPERTKAGGEASGEEGGRGPAWPITPGVRRVIEAAINEAKNLSHNHVGTEHLLLGLLTPSCPAVTPLRQLGVTAERVREEILLLLLLGHDIDSVVPEELRPIRKTYANHTPGQAGLSRLLKVRRAFSKLHDKLEMLCPASRELSVALTNLETAAMWATKAIVVNDPEARIDWGNGGKTQANHGNQSQEEGA